MARRLLRDNRPVVDRRDAVRYADDGREETFGETAAATPYAYDRPSAAWSVANIIYALLGILEVLLAFRFVFKLLGANQGSSFVNFIYTITYPFVAPFFGIFRQATTSGLEAQSVLEPATILAAVVYAVIAWFIVRLVTAGRRAV